MKAYRGKGARLIVDVVREPSPTELDNAAPMRMASDVASLFRWLQDLGKIPREREAFVVVALNARHKPIAWHVVSIGTMLGTSVHPREVFRPMLVAGATAVVVAHNHPSGDPRPSAEDADVTTRLRDAGDLLGITVLDHVVVGDGRHYSFAEGGSLR